MKIRHILIALIMLVSCNRSNDRKQQLGKDALPKEQKIVDSLGDLDFEKAVSKYYSEKQINRKRDSLMELERVKYDTLYSFVDSIITIKGIIQSSGIRKDYQVGVEADFQITNPQRSFFLTTTKDLSPYWGKCVSVKGRFVKGWDADMSKYTFGISAMRLDSIKDVSSNYCFNSPVFRPLKNDSYVIQHRDTTVKGVIVRSKRISPDISYDYRLKLEKPVHNQNDGWGETSNFFLSINMNLDSLNNVIENKRVVTLYGIFTGGYLESTIFSCKKVIRTK